MDLLHDRNFYMASLESSTSQKKDEVPSEQKTIAPLIPRSLKSANQKTADLFSVMMVLIIVMMKMTIKMTKTVRI